MQLSGLSSGLDTQAIIQQLIEIERQPIRQLKLTRSELTSERTLWNSINAKTSSLQQTLAAIVDQAAGQEPFLEQKEAVSSHPDTVTASASASAVNGTYEFQVSQLAEPAQAVSDQSAGTSEILSGSITITATAGVEETVVGDGKTLSQLASDINNAFKDEKDAGGVYARATVMGGHLMITRSETGLDADFAVNSSLSTPSASLTSFTVHQGQDSQMSVDTNGDGTPELVHTSTSNSVDDFIDGVTLTLHKVNPDPVSVEIQRDLKAINQDLKSFVSAFNDLFGQLKDETGRDQPLQGDSTARMLATRLRSDLSRIASDHEYYRSLFDIGFELTTDGTLSFEPAAFEQALDQQPAEVAAVLSNTLGTMHDHTLNRYLESGGIFDHRFEYFDRRQTAIEDSIEAMEYRVEQRRETLTAQFVQMESALSEMNSQMSWLSQQLSGLMISPGSGGNR